MVLFPILCDHACHQSEGSAVHSQLTAQDFENYGTELIDMTRRAAVEAVGPELQRLHAGNQHLRQVTARSQRTEIERALDRQVPNWRQVYQDPRFSEWPSLPDEYSGQIRSQLMRHAVASGDAARVVAFYQGFVAEAGQPQYRSRQPAAATRNRPTYTRDQIKQLYDRRAHGTISDAQWAPLEADIVKAASEGRINSVFDKYGNETRFR
jgi:hypothetical protein